jgi:hypothetical protein
MEHQQELKQFDLGVVVLVAPTNDINDLRPLMPSVIASLDTMTPRPDHLYKVKSLAHAISHGA